MTTSWLTNLTLFAMSYALATSWYHATAIYTGKVLAANIFRPRGTPAP
ncbi:hypothetical protein KXD97_17545 [Mycobacterium sp. SMC-8]|nr:hypothetical protein [Mycobacterium sp. SMC-8]UXA09992.1 hypothetical protein KXD97_17545 [Mycobacterium sp. SMC-8]